MVCLASRGQGQLALATQSSIKLITLLLSARVLPVRTERVGERPVQLLLKRLACIQLLQQLLRIFSPVYTSVLLSRTTDALNLAEVQALFTQPF